MARSDLLIGDTDGRITGTPVISYVQAFVISTAFAVAAATGEADPVFAIDAKCIVGTIVIVIAGNCAHAAGEVVSTDAALVTIGVISARTADLGQMIATARTDDEHRQAQDQSRQKVSQIYRVDHRFLQMIQDPKNTDLADYADSPFSWDSTGRAVTTAATGNSSRSGLTISNPNSSRLARTKR